MADDIHESDFIFLNLDQKEVNMRYRMPNIVTRQLSSNTKLNVLPTIWKESRVR